MNKRNEKNIPDYSDKNRKDVPEEFSWRVKDLYPDAGAWEADKKRLLEMIGQIDVLAKDWTTTPHKMFQLLDHVDKVEIKEYRLYVYTTLQVDTDMGNSRLQAMKGDINTIDVDLEGKLTFIDPDILALGEEKIKRYLEEEPKLDIYRFKFETVLREKPYILPSDKEEIVARTGLFSTAAKKAAGLLNDLDIPAPRLTLSDGERIRLNTANYIKYRGVDNAKDRRKVMRTFWRNRAKFQNTHAALLDGGTKNHYFNAQVHHYDSCLEAALFPENIHPDVYLNLIRRVKGNLEPLHRFLDLKARLLGLDQLLYEDLYTPSISGVEKEYTIEEAKEIIIEAMKPLGDEYTSLLRTGLHGGWMDVYPNKGKRSGAYSNGSVYDAHPFVLMNYNGKFENVSTLAHEFGHALHSWLTNKNQSFVNSHYSTMLAEIASTFNEALLVHYMVENETDDRVKLFILDQYVEHFRGTLYRQTLFAEFELLMHREIEKGGTLTPEWLGKEYLKLTRSYYGHRQGVVKVPKFIENEWSGIPHFYYNFYVFQYSTGVVASTVLSEMVLNGGKAERDRYIKMLQSGSKTYPLDILKEAGVDLTRPEPYDRAMAELSRIVSQMEQISERLLPR